MIIHSSTGKSPATRRLREKQERHSAILDAAERVFAEHGFHGATMDRIAEEAEYAPGTIYLYFKDKDALYSALFARKITQMVDQVDAAAKAGADPLEGLRNAIRAQFEFNERNREFFEVFSRHRVKEQPPRAEEWKTIGETIDRHHGVLRRLVEKGQRAKLIRPGDPQAFASALVGIILHMSREMERQGVHLNKEADFVFELFLKGAQRVPSSP